MEANELRIGNFINWVDKKDYARICNLNDFNIVYESLNNNESVFTGIPLTEEWLLKFGFKLDKISDFKWYDLNDISISFKEERVAQKVGEMYNRFEIPKYVHILQNLYFSLTGKELEVK